MKPNNSAATRLNKDTTIVRPKGLGYFLLVANVIPIIAVLDFYFWGLFPIESSWSLALLGLGLIVAILNLICIPRLISLRQPLQVSSVAALTAILLSVCYIVWVGYVAYGIGQYV
jgi:hypothetical protein